MNGSATLAEAPAEPAACATPGTATASSSLAGFAVVWATATLIHLLSFHFWARTWEGWTLLLCTSLVLLRPQSPARFLAMVAASLANLFHAMPFVPNHILFEGMVNVTILLAAVGVACRRRDELRRAWAERFRPRELVVPGIALAVYLVVLTRFLVVPDVGGALTAAMIVLLGRRRHTRIVPGKVSDASYRRFAGVLRWELAAMYWWAVVQKLNRDYFHPQVGSAIVLQRRVEAWLHLPASPDWLAPVFAGGSLLIEASIPVLLLIRRTRAAGFVLAIAFHLWLGLIPHPGVYSYSALVLAMLYVFLPAGRIAALRAIWSRQRQRLAGRPERLAAGVIVAFFVLGISSSLLYSVLGHERRTFEIVNTLGLVAFLVWGVWLGACYLRCWWTRGLNSEDSLPPAGWTPAWVGLLLVVLNGACPWVGLKTQTSFAMFSNLRTEFAPNHLFLRRVDLFPYQRDMVEIVASEPDLLAPPESPRSVEQFANPGRILPYFELRRLLSRQEGDVRVTIRRDGATEVVRRVDGVAEPADAFDPPTPWEAKLLWFRRHDAWSGPMPCTH